MREKIKKQEENMREKIMKQEEKIKKQEEEMIFISCIKEHI